MKTIYVAENIQVDADRSVEILSTPGKGAYGIHKAPQVRDGKVTEDWQVYLETNGDPVILPHADYPDELADVLATAGVSQEEFEAALGCSWSDWCN